MRILWCFLMMAVILPACAVPQQKEKAPDNFRGVKWAADISTLSGFTDAGEAVPTFEGVKRYKRNEDKKVGEIEVDDIVYTFYKGKFSMGTIFFKDPNAHVLFIQALDKKYGKGTKLNVELEELQNSYTWDAGDVTIILAYANAKGMGRLIYQYKPLVDEWLDKRLKTFSDKVNKEQKDQEKVFEKLKDKI